MFCTCNSSCAINYHFSKNKIYDIIIKIPQSYHCVISLYRTFNIYVEDIMVRNVRFISWLSTYADLKYLLDNSMLQSFPLVDAPGKSVTSRCQRSQFKSKVKV